MRVEENVQPVSADGATAVKHVNRLGIVVAWHNHFRPECVPFVGGDKCVALPDPVAVRGLAVTVLPAALLAWAIARHPHVMVRHRAAGPENVRSAPFPATVHGIAERQIATTSTLRFAGRTSH
jgi:hypothetical protein